MLVPMVANTVFKIMLSVVVIMALAVLHCVPFLSTVLGTPCSAFPASESQFLDQQDLKAVVFYSV